MSPLLHVERHSGTTLASLCWGMCPVGKFDKPIKDDDDEIHIVRFAADGSSLRTCNGALSLFPSCILLLIFLARFTAFKMSGMRCVLLICPTYFPVTIIDIYIAYIVGLYKVTAH